MHSYRWVGRLRPCCGVVDRRGRHPIEGAIPLPPPLGEGLTCSRGRGGLAAVGVAAAGRADVRRWQRRVVAAAGSGGYWRVWPRWAAAGRAVVAVGVGSGGQRRVVAGVAAAGVAAAGATAVGVVAAGVAAAGVDVCVVAMLLGLKVWEAPAREVWARMEGKSQRMLAAAAAWPGVSGRRSSRSGEVERRGSSLFSSLFAAISVHIGIVGSLAAVAVRNSAVHVAAEWQRRCGSSGRR